MEALFQAILEDDRAAAEVLLKADPSLPAARITEAKYYDDKIYHWMYVGDTALHFAAAGYRVAIVQLLLASGADPNAAANHRHSGPLHYASDGYVSGPLYDAGMQVKTIESLLAAGAHINAPDKNGATPLHRAVRTRCAAAVRTLLKAGACPTLLNKPGSTPFHLAVQNTGRGGSGTDQAREGQRGIIEEFLRLGVSPTIKDCHGKTVLDWIKSDWIREIFRAKSR